MHEHALIDELIAALLQELEKQGIKKSGSVREVWVKVGELEMHSEESFRQVFQTRAQGTLLEGAAIKFELIHATIKCAACGFEGPSPDGEADGHDPIPCAECPSCGVVCVLNGGRGVESMEILVDGGFAGPA